MGKKLLLNSRVYAIQNGIAAALFLLLLTNEVLAYLLNSYPSSETLWMLTLNINRLVGPFVATIEPYFHQPYALMAALACAAMMPLVAYRRRSWLGTAVSGHMALGGYAVMSFTALDWFYRDVATASLAGDVYSLGKTTGIFGLIAMTLLMVVLCLLNHVMFFMRVKTL